MAFLKLGQDPLEAFSDDTASGVAASSLYYHNRNMLLRKIPWSFAKKWAALASLTAAPLSLDFLSPGDRGTGNIIFTNAYQLPRDCVRVHRFSPKHAQWRVVGRTIYTTAVPLSAVPGPLLGVQPPPAYSEEGNAVTTTGFSTAPNPVGIEYISNLVNPGLYDTLFVEALINKMAMDMAFGANGLEQIVQLSKKDYQDALLEAAYVNGVETPGDVLFDTTIVDVRMGYGNSGIDFSQNG
jgi:hypothetical protein